MKTESNGNRKRTQGYTNTLHLTFLPQRKHRKKSMIQHKKQNLIYLIICSQLTNLYSIFKNLQPLFNYYFLCRKLNFIHEDITHLP